MERAALAYHIGLLRHVGLIEMVYERRGRKTTSYRLSDLGKRVIRDLGSVITIDKSMLKQSTRKRVAANRKSLR